MTIYQQDREVSRQTIQRPGASAEFNNLIPESLYKFRVTTLDNKYSKTLNDPMNIAYELTCETNRKEPGDADQLIKLLSYQLLNEKIKKSSEEPGLSQALINGIKEIKEIGDSLSFRVNVILAIFGMLFIIVSFLLFKFYSYRRNTKKERDNSTERHELNRFVHVGYSTTPGNDTARRRRNVINSKCVDL